MKNKKEKIIILIFVASLVIILFSFYLNSRLFLKREEVTTTLAVGDRAGIDLNKTALTFGVITSGSVSSRSLLIENDYDFPIKTELRAEGSIKKFLVFEKDVYLEPGENKTVSIGTIDPLGDEFGNYSGKIIVITRRNLWG